MGDGAEGKRENRDSVVEIALRICYLISSGCGSHEAADRRWVGHKHGNQCNHIGQGDGDPDE